MRFCLKCGGDIPSSVLIAGVRRSLRTRKYCLECSPFGARNTRSLLASAEPGAEPTHKKCSKCGEVKPFDEFYASKSRRHSWCRTCFKKHTAERNRRNKMRLVMELGGKCSNPECGYDRHPQILHFHHTDPSKKDFQISANISWGYDRLRKEVEKCVLFCPTCHAEQHIDS